ncbi:hypothetical protein [Anaerovibrio sp. RM50]|uniref:hypothetical protein n=1 Tax=Anaerovibrio sp. RM50 TaxID=1200557 RepID=UPI000487B7A2|nr:hypothetical protein [Anaerovibrio sp. RM50]
MCQGFFILCIYTIIRVITPKWLTFRLAFIAADADEATRAKKLELAKNTKAVVFGGHPNWQNDLKNAVPGFTVVDADNYGFDAKIMDKADAVVMKTDYMAHAQWYKVIERARKLKKKVVFFSGNSIDELLVKIDEDL